VRKSLIPAACLWLCIAAGLQAEPIQVHPDNPHYFLYRYYPIWYAGDKVAASRVEAWEFVVGGGAGFNHLRWPLHFSSSPQGLRTEHRRDKRGAEKKGAEKREERRHRREERGEKREGTGQVSAR
jgi:hypothetical protein